MIDSLSPSGSFPADLLSPDDVQEALAALRWQIDMGVEEGVNAEPCKVAGAPKPAPLASPLASPSTVAPFSPDVEQASPLPLAAPPPSAPVSTPLSALDSLEALREALSRLTGLSVKDTAMNLVFGEGALIPPVMVVGEAPGEEEDRTGRPFVGAAGRLLDKMLASIGIARDSIYITNVLNWRPPGNRTPRPEEVATCLPYLMRHVELVRPRSLLLVGGPAAQALLGSRDSVTRLRGKWWSYHSPGLGEPIPALVTYHPAYLLRTPAQKRESWRDLLRVKKKIEGDQV